MNNLLIPVFCWLISFWLLGLQIFSPIIWIVFNVFMIFFAVQKILSLIRSHLFIFVFFFIILGVNWKRYCSNLYQREFCLYFIVSGLTFTSLIHIGSIFVYGVRKYSNFILLYVPVQFSQRHLLKWQFFLHCIFLPPFS